MLLPHISNDRDVVVFVTFERALRVEALKIFSHFISTHTITISIGTNPVR